MISTSAELFVRCPCDGQVCQLSAYPAGLFIAPYPEDFTWSSILASARNVVPLSGERGMIDVDAAQRHLVWSTVTWEDNVGHLFAIDLDEMRILAHHRQPSGNPFSGVEISRDGSCVLTSCFDGVVRCWDFKTWPQPVKSAATKVLGTRLVFSPTIAR